MDLTLVLGPVKSGKSLELISQFAPLAYSNISHRVYQSARHQRDTQVMSRSGGALNTTKVLTLAALHEDCSEVVGIDEVHMFSRKDVKALTQLLTRGQRLVVTGIDLDHRGELFDTVVALYELGPEQVIYRRAVCEVCKDFSAIYTQVLDTGVPYLDKLGNSEALPDTGHFTYEARCRKCFIFP